jgi:putative nucleotidyltransferase with HDIG domain
MRPDSSLIGLLCFWSLLALGFYLHLKKQTRRQVAAETSRVRLEAVEALAIAINAKDSITADHVRRVQIYAEGVARLLNCSPAEIEALRSGALLHDVGKIAVPDAILCKTGKLTEEEFQQMKLHTVVGDQILSKIHFPYPVAQVVRSHHERWDGTGYPDGLIGTEIPLVARILSVVDCFDAVREDRHYRKGMSRKEAIDLVQRGAGTLYDPEVVDVFLFNLESFEARIRSERSWILSDFGVCEVEPLKGAARQALPAAGVQ